MTYTLSEVIAEYTGDVAFQFTNYIEDVDDDPTNDTIYQVFTWDWGGNWEPIYPPIYLYPPTPQRSQNNER